MGGKGKANASALKNAMLGVAGRPPRREMNLWISKDKEHTNEKGVEGGLGSLVGAERWTKSLPECTSIEDMEGIESIE